MSGIFFELETSELATSRRYVPVIGSNPIYTGRWSLVAIGIRKARIYPSPYASLTMSLSVKSDRLTFSRSCCRSENFFLKSVTVASLRGSTEKMPCFSLTRISPRHHRYWQKRNMFPRMSLGILLWPI